MEKRTIIAFVLSFLVLLIWSFLFTPREDQTPTTKESEVKKKDEVSVEHPQKQKPEAAPPQQEKAVPAVPLQPAESVERKIYVETPLYQATFSNSGAKITGFRLKKYTMTTDPGSPFVELLNHDGSTRNFLGVGFEHPAVRPEEEIIYRVKPDRVQVTQGGPPQELTFTGMTRDGLSVVQTFRFHPDRYPIDLHVSIQNGSTNGGKGTVRASLRNTPPKEKQSSYAFNGLALLRNKKLEEIDTDDLKEGKTSSGQIGWMAYEGDYFMTAFIALDAKEFTFQGRRLNTGSLEATLSTPAVPLDPGAQISAGYLLYLGPRELDTLKGIGKNIELAINFGWFDVIAKPLLYTLRFFNKYVNNYGLAIILLTVLVKILFWPLTHKSYKSMKEMQKIQPLMAKIRERYKDNRELMNKEMMALYRTYKVNPMGGCLPMLIQIPVFFALFRILGSAIELRHAPFLLWINDLSAPDRLFHFPFEIPFMSPPHGIPVLTLLMGASMFIQQKMTPTPGDQAQAKIMMFLPLIFTVMFINFPSGLVLYWLVNNLLSIGQQYRILKKSA